jgi:16S rRNA (cytosine1402-N4)-methyltransferase
LNDHVPVLLEEAVQAVAGAEGVYVDATFGRGGHCRRLLQRLGPGSRVIAMDRDPAAVAAGQTLAADDQRLEMAHGNFAELADVLARLGVAEVQGVMMDLGVSSPQLDDPARGFSFRYEAALDMRMDTSRGRTAAEWLNSADEAEIARVLHEYGEERYSRRIAAAIVAARPLTTTTMLADVVRSAQPRATPGKHEATRVFQAVRIQVNQELQSLQAGLAAAFAALAPGGRLAVISFHSLEDRVVKRYFKALTSPPPLPRRLPVRAAQIAVPARLAGPAVTPSEAELRTNPRARSARLRVLERAA